MRNKEKSSSSVKSVSLFRKAYRIDKTGSLKRLRSVEETIPDPQPDEVRIAVKTIGLNFADIFAIFGLYSATPEGSFVPGLEYAGVVEAVGSTVENVKPGDKVMGVTRFGSYASHLNIDSRYVVPLPAGWSFEEGSGFLVQVLTAYYALFNLGNHQPGGAVLIHSVAGGVGIQANRLAKKAGAFTIGTVGNESKVALAKKEGCDRVIVRGKDFAQQLETALEGRELPLILDSIGGKIFKDSYAAMASMGRIVVYGSARYASPGNRPNYLKMVWTYLTRPKIDPQNMTNENKAVMAFNLIWLYERAHIMKELISDIEKMDIGAPHVGHVFEWDEMHDALRLFLSGKTVGKVVVKI